MLSRAFALLALILVAAVGCGGTGDGPVVDTLPADGELGAGWERASEPRVGDNAESSSLCETGLDEDAVDGAKIDFARGPDFASAYFRRYADTEVAAAAFDIAADQIARCPSPEGFEVLSLGTPMVGDEAYSAAFSAPGTDPAFVADFGWTLVRTGDVIRSLQFIPAPGESDVETDLRALTEAVALS